jgi:Cu/Ag efflux pump CusA
MALVSIGGQVVGTVLLLGVIPALYMVFNTSPHQWLGGKKSLSR